MSVPTLSLDSACQQLKTKALELGVSLEEPQVEAFKTFLTELYAYNEHTNLVGDAHPCVVVQNHILDCLSLVPIIDRCIAASSTQRLGQRLTVVDVGSGAGFPGLILALTYGQIKMTLVESVSKKARFLELAVSGLGLADRVVVLNERAEVVARDKNLRDSFHVAVSRALGTVDVVAELALPLVGPGGWLLVQKSNRQVAHELQLASRALPCLGGRMAEVVSPSLEALGKDHVVLVIEKLAPTAVCYPRPTPQIRRRPLGTL